MSSLTESVAWQALKSQQKAMQSFSIKKSFAQDQNRFSKFSRKDCKILFDFSKNLIDQTSFDLLLNLAKQAQVSQKISDLFNGFKVNTSEQQAVLHTILRKPIGYKVELDGVNIVPVIHLALSKMSKIVSEVHNGLWRGFNGREITDIVNIGIGGSYLGQYLVSEGLLPYRRAKINCHYLANIDGSEFYHLTQKVKAESTLFIISSKSFSTLETIKNACSIKNWYFAQGGTKEGFNQHFLAVTANAQKAVEFGLEPFNIIPMWDYIGGRYSLWSAIGLPIAFSIEMSNFMELLSGAFSVDQHVQQQDLAQNIPLIMALLDVWYSNFWDAQTKAVLPYDYYLRNFTQHLQQLDMESNGKSVQLDGSQVDYKTGSIIWGGLGCNGQHAYHQLLHQGTHLVPVDFIVPAVSHNFVDDHHYYLYANCLAQSQSLMEGKSYSEVVLELQNKGLSAKQIEHLAPHKVIIGNKPSNTLVLDRVTPFSLGALIALYEHKVFLQSVILNINAFDQFSVELGKSLSYRVYEALKGSNLDGLDSSTKALVDYFRLNQRG